MNECATCGKLAIDYRGHDSFCDYCKAPTCGEDLVDVAGEAFACPACRLEIVSNAG